PQPARRVFVDIAITAQALDRFAGHPCRFFRGVENCTRSVLARRFAAVARSPDGVDIGAARVLTRVHVGNFALDQLELADRLAELLAFVHVRHHDVHTRRHDAERASGQHDAFVVETAHQYLDAFTFAAEDVLRGHLA